MVRLLTLAVCAILLTGCSGGGKNDEVAAKMEPLLDNYRKLACEQADLEKQVDELWGGISKGLDAQLPPDMPTDERRNMINIRNTRLIEMFEIYPRLDDNIHQLVTEAGQKDSLIAIQAMGIQKQLEANETEIMALLTSLEQAQSKALSRWKTAFEQAKTQGCPEKQ